MTGWRRAEGLPTRTTHFLEFRSDCIKKHTRPGLAPLMREEKRKWGRKKFRVPDISAQIFLDRYQYSMIVWNYDDNSRKSLCRDRRI